MQDALSAAKTRLRLHEILFRDHPDVSLCVAFETEMKLTVQISQRVLNLGVLSCHGWIMVEAVSAVLLELSVEILLMLRSEPIHF